MLKKLKEFLFSREKTCEEVWQEEYEADRFAHPEWFRESDLMQAQYAYNTGVSMSVIFSAFGQEIAEEVVKNCNIKTVKQKSI